MLSWWIAVVVSVVAGGLLGLLYRSRAALGSRLLTLSAVSILGVIAFVWTYGLVFESDECANRSDVGCMLNQNQGVLGAFALLVAFGSFWLSYVVDRDQRIRELDGAKRSAMALLDQAVMEAHHNLVHIALAFEGGRLTKWPQVSIERTREICSPHYRALIPSPYAGIADLLVRNYQTMRERMTQLPADYTLPKDLVDEVQAASGNADNEPSSILEDPKVQQYVNQLGVERFKAISPLLNQHVHLVLQAAIHQLDVAKQLEHPALVKLGKELQAAALETVAPGSNQSDYFYFPRSSEAAVAISTIRNERCPLLCWYVDQTFDGVEIINVHQLFLDRALGHRH